MDKAAALEAIQQFREALDRQGIRVNKMILFGSYATGTYTDDSDIDVVVISDFFRGLNHWQRIECMSAALYEVFKPIEARALTPEEWKANTLTAQYAKSDTSIDV